MKSGKPAVLAASLLVTTVAHAGPSTVSGPNALALAGLVALYSPLLSSDERETAAALFVGEKDVRYARKITISADKIVCRVSNVDITARSCELTFNGKKQTIGGRRASEVFATEALAGVTTEGAAGSVFAGLSNLNCTVDPKAIKQRDGSGASCTFEPGN
jgi:hypothetical protein